MRSRLIRIVSVGWCTYCCIVETDSVMREVNLCKQLFRAVGITTVVPTTCLQLHVNISNLVASPYIARAPYVKQQNG
jgi:hypothetical protein